VVELSAGRGRIDGAIQAGRLVLDCDDACPGDEVFRSGYIKACKNRSTWDNHTVGSRTRRTCCTRNRCRDQRRGVRSVV